MASGYVKLDLKNTRVVSLHKDFRQKILDVLANPNLAYIFMMLGILGILAEVQNPGMIFPGVVGAISLLFGLYAMQTLSLDYTALALIGFSCILFLLEVYIVSYGLLSLAGFICMVLGSIMLARSGSEFGQFSFSFVAVIATASAIFASCMAYLAAKSQKLKRYDAYEQLMQESAVSLTAITAKSGLVRVRGELWQARCLDANTNTNEEIPPGTPVKIVAHKGLSLIVEKE